MERKEFNLLNQSLMVHLFNVIDFNEYKTLEFGENVTNTIKGRHCRSNLISKIDMLLTYCFENKEPLYIYLPELKILGVIISNGYLEITNNITNNKQIIIKGQLW